MKIVWKDIWQCDSCQWWHWWHPGCCPKCGGWTTPVGGQFQVIQAPATWWKPWTWFQLPAHRFTGKTR